MKICPRCKEKKPLDGFFRKSDRLAGAYCKPCQLEYVREHYRRTKGAYNARRYALHAIYTNRNRGLVLKHLKAHPCVDCGEPDLLVLDFDHITGNKHGDISRMIRGGTSVERLLAEIAKCVVRCSNCHRRKTAAERGSYRNSPWLYEELPKTTPRQKTLWDGGGSNSRQMA